MKKSESAKWIWCTQNDLREYNQTVLLKKEFSAQKISGAELKITADSWYRVSINGRWVHDGPARAYPNHYLYDVHDISGFLKKGKNRIEVIARYFGIGTFHQIPQQAGLWAEISGIGKPVVTDASWEATPAYAWQSWTPKISIQMEPYELYDAGLETVFDWQPAVEVKRKGKLSPRPVALLTKVPRRFKNPPAAAIVARVMPQYAVPVTQIAHPGLIEANRTVGRPVILYALLTVKKKQTFDFTLPNHGSDSALHLQIPCWQISVAGQIVTNKKIALAAGTYPVLFCNTQFFSHEKDSVFPYLNLPGAQWDGWRAAVLQEYLFAGDDMLWVSFENKDARRAERGYFKTIERLAAACKTEADVHKYLKTGFVDIPADRIFMDDPAAEFGLRRVLGDAQKLIAGKTVKPSKTGDVELCFDMGEQTCGYFDFSIKADAGVIVDINAIEYIRKDGALQHVYKFNRNGMRYITKKGVNRFISLKRRSGRYFFITLRNQKTPVEIQSFKIIESTAPVSPAGFFKSSDASLNRIWEISERTLKLCMEDTFTDCPLYEQTFWVGDARNEALYAFTAYGNTDVSARGLEICAQSLERYPIVGCQVPSAWDCLLPAWSFLWGMQVWEHYFYSGDKVLLKKLWPAVLKNIDGALGMLDSNGLFSGKFWNLLEWAPIDQKHATVLHNSLLLSGTIAAAEKCAAVLNDLPAAKKLRAARRKLIKAINKTWNDKKQSYPDSIHENGRPSPKTCQQTSMLAVMCDVIEKENIAAARRNLLKKPQNMTPVCAPFAMQFYYEALERLNEPEAILKSIYKSYQPMIDDGATTVWETFAGSTASPKGFPTRSHCHAWSSSPVYFLNRIILGIRQTAAGGRAFEISPWVKGLNFARGATAIPGGAISVDWKRSGSSLKLVVDAPENVTVDFVSNASLRGLEINVIRN
ncbi:MAG: alpha-L-rhamnosidase C-terminal domain-containing protein [Kiritimatiellales bacterium]